MGVGLICVRWSFLVPFNKQDVNRFERMVVKAKAVMSGLGSTVNVRV